MPCGKHTGDLHRPERVILFFFRRGNNEIDAHELQMISAQEHLHELKCAIMTRLWPNSKCACGHRED